MIVYAQAWGSLYEREPNIAFGVAIPDRERKAPSALARPICNVAGIWWVFIRLGLAEVTVRETTRFRPQGSTTCGTFRHTKSQDAQERHRLYLHEESRTNCFAHQIIAPVVKPREVGCMGRGRNPRDIPLGDPD